MNVNHKNDKLVAIHALVANDYLLCFFPYSFEVFSLQIYDIQGSIANFQTVYPSDYELGLDVGVWLLNIEFKQKISQFTFVLVGQDVEFVVVVL